jgi:hypothetical protein
MTLRLGIPYRSWLRNMPNIYLRHPKHGEKVAISWLEAREDMEYGWEEFDPSDPDDTESPASSEMAASESSGAGNALRARRRRKE